MTSASLIAVQYLEQIATGHLADGTLISPRALAQEEGISLVTAMTVLRMIAGAGNGRYITGQGLRVTAARRVLPVPEARAVSALGGSPTGRILAEHEHSRVLSAGFSMPPAWVADILGTASDQAVLHRVRLTMHPGPDGTPEAVSYSTSYKTSADVAAVPAYADTARMLTGGLRQILAARGTTPADGWEEYRAADLPEHVATALGLDPRRTPAINTRNVWLDSAGVGFEVGESWVPGDTVLRRTYPLPALPEETP